VDRVMHLYNNNTEYKFPPRTYCGRIVSSDEGYHDIMATDSEEEYTCKSCRRVVYKMVCRG
jgi:hypothetical protein